MFICALLCDLHLHLHLHLISAISNLSSVNEFVRKFGPPRPPGHAAHA
jgi:hypothetical protein